MVLRLWNCNSHYKAGEERICNKEAISVLAEIKYISTQRICFTQVSLIENVTYYSFSGRFSETSILVTIHKGGVAPRGKQTWQKELLNIPTAAPSHLRGCKIIDVQYYLELSIKPAGIARKVKLPLDIFIGTIPVSQSTSPRTSYHPLLSTISESSYPYPFSENISDQVFLTDKLCLQHMLPTDPPWEEDDDIS